MTEKRNVRSNDLRMSIRDEESRPQTNWQPPALLDLQKYVLEWFNDGSQPRFRVRTLPTTYIKKNA